MMSVRPNVFYKKWSPLMVAIMASSAMFLSACNDSNTQADTKQIETTADLSIFEGCYTVSHDEPAQIKVSQQGGAWVMQMKEPASAKRVWDDAEPLAKYRHISLSTLIMSMRSSVVQIECWYWRM